MSIEEADPTFRSGRVDFAGIVKSVNLSYVPEAVVGNYVVVHVGSMTHGGVHVTTRHMIAPTCATS